MGSIKGLNTFITKTEKQKAQIKQKASTFVRGKVLLVLKDLVNQTPQWTGDLAGSWTVLVGESLQGFKLKDYSNLKEEYLGYYTEITPKWMGDKEALNYAVRNAQGDLSRIRYNSVISIVNTSPTSEKVDNTDNTIGGKLLRPGNYIPGDLLAINAVRLKYKYLRYEE